MVRLICRNVRWNLGLLVVVAALSSGCGGLEEFPVAPVKGKILCEGQPVQYAMVFFEPLASGKAKIVGKQGICVSNENGEFVVTTYHDNDGAVIGKHHVHVLPASDRPGTKCSCEYDSKVAPLFAEVKQGENNFFTFELPPPTNARPMRQMTLQDKEAMQEAAAEEASRREEELLGIKRPDAPPVPSAAAANAPD